MLGGGRVEISRTVPLSFIALLQKDKFASMLQLILVGKQLRDEIALAEKVLDTCTLSSMMSTEVMRTRIPASGAAHSRSLLYNL